MLRIFLITGLVAAIFPGVFQSMSVAQNKREQQVRNDKKTISKDKSWYYDDLDAGLAIAKKVNKPLMVVLRCIP